MVLLYAQYDRLATVLLKIELEYGILIELLISLDVLTTRSPIYPHNA